FPRNDTYPACSAGQINKLFPAKVSLWDGSKFLKSQSDTYPLGTSQGTWKALSETSGLFMPWCRSKID
ncbi:MAG: hypothetical protein ACPGWR_28665, partial [Ardenticatenaceae bacterium]